MNKTMLLGVASLLLTGCSAPKPPVIAGKYEAVNLAKPKPVSQELLLLQKIHSQLILNQQTMIELNSEETTSSFRSFVLHYPFNQTTASIAQIEPALVAAKSACKIEIRARTDGTIPTKGDQTVAKQRAINLRGQFIQYGVLPQTININYAASTDYADDNWTAQGRANNRRVEIDIYENCMDE